MSLQNEIIERYAESFPDSRIGRCIKIIERAAQKKINLLIQGETGTGKTTLINFIAKKLFTGKPLVTVSCFNLSGDLFQSVLCGHLKGAFTGAVETTEGKAQAANNGSLFFDDVDTLSIDNQSKLLYFLDYHVCEKVGSTTPEALNLWAVFSTNSNIEDKIRSGLLREDFYYRISTIKVNIPPLRERPNFIEYFIGNYLERLQISYGRKFMSECLGYSWPGNIRELTSALDRIQILNEEGCKKVRSLSECGIKIRTVNFAAQEYNKTGSNIIPFKQNNGNDRNLNKEEVGSGLDSNEDIFNITSEKNRIIYALKKARYKRNQACKILDISNSTLWRKLKQYGLYEKLQ